MMRRMRCDSLIHRSGIQENGEAGIVETINTRKDLNMKFRDEIYAIMFHLLNGTAEKEKNEFNALVEQVKPFDEELFFRIDEAFGAALAATQRAAFESGFKCGQDPTILLERSR